MTRSSTMQDVADEAGVSKATVSMVFRNRPGISEPTRQRVQEAARKLRYQLLPTRGGGSRVRFGQVGLFLLSEGAPRVSGQPGASYLHSILEGCMVEADKQGRSLVTFFGSFDQVRSGQLPVALQRSHLDGLLFRGWLLPELDAVFGDPHLPVVLIDSDRRVPGRPQIQIDNIQAMQDLVRHLAGCGARRFATITGDMEHVNGQERLAGLQMALRAHGLSLPEKNVVIEHGFSEESGQRGAASLLERGAAFDTLVCQNDLIAAGACDVLLARGLRVPDDVRLTGFDNMEFAARLPVPLTTLDPEPYRIGLAGARLLNDLLERPESARSLLKMPVRLVVRASSKGRAVRKAMREKVGMRA